MPKPAVSLEAAAVPHVEYRPFEATAALPANALLAVIFGGRPVPHPDPRLVRVRLEPLEDTHLTELWLGNGSVHRGHKGPIHYAADTDFLAGVLELDELRHGGIAAAANVGYAKIGEFLRDSRYPHLLRVWNYFRHINGGVGDAERYKQFCVGRAAGFGPANRYPAATVIGHGGSESKLQIYWLAGRAPGMAVENPRQTDPQRYPREYGPSAPQFSRAMLMGGHLVMISGTASIVGHASRHPGNLRLQLNETLDNLRSVLQRAASQTAGISCDLGKHSMLKIYLRDPAGLPVVQAVLRERLPREIPLLILMGDICRTDLLVEVECVQSAS